MTRKVFIDCRAGAVATVVAVALTAVESDAGCGHRPAGVHHDQPAARPISARGIIAGRRCGSCGAFAGIVGTGIAIAATQNRRDYYDSYGYYDCVPTYYGGGPVYGYGGGGYYGGHRPGVPYFNGHPNAGW